MEFYEAVSDWVDEVSAVDVVYVDFQKEFDEVPHRRQLDKVAGNNIETRKYHPSLH